MLSSEGNLANETVKKWREDKLKKVSHKLLSLSAVGLLSLGLLAGCSQGESAEKAETSKTKEQQEKVSIEYWHANADTQGGKTVTALVDNFNQSQDEIQVTEKFNPDMYKGLMQNMQAAVASKTTPDVVQIGWAFLDYFSTNFEYSEPQKLAAEMDPDNATFLEDNFLPNVLDLAKNNEGKQVGVPYSLSTPVLYINQDLLKEAGLSATGPKTWQEVQSFAKTIKEKTAKYGVYIQEPMDNWATQALLESNGATFITDGKATFASPEGIEAYQLWADMVLTDKSAPNIGWDEGVQSFIKGDVAMLYTTIAQRNNVQSNINFAATTVSSPAWEGKTPQLPAGGAMLAITATTDEKKKASWEFMKYLYSIESVSEWTKGTGYVPPRKDVAEAENGLKAFLAENEMMQPAIAQMDKVVSWSSFPGDSGLAAEQKLLDMRDQILTGKVPVADALEQTQKEINELLK